MGESQLKNAVPPEAPNFASNAFLISGWVNTRKKVFRVFLNDFKQLLEGAGESGSACN